MTQPHKISAILALTLNGLTHSALALDCKKAASPFDKSLCASPEALAADAAMSSAYTSLAAMLGDMDRKQLLASQRAWLKLRVNMCSDDTKAAAKCIIDESDKRTHLFLGKPDSGPGTGQELGPIIRAQPGTKKTYEVDVTVLKFKSPVAPGEMLFNKEVDKLLKDVPSAKDTDDAPDMTFSYDLHLGVTYASPQFLSAHSETYVFSGGAHGNSGTNNINIDIAKGRILPVSDMFEASALKKFEDLCVTQIKAQRTEKGAEQDETAEDIKKTQATIRDTLSKSENWSFSAKEASVDFDAYVLGSYAEGPYNCKFPTETTRPLYKAGSILP